MRCADPSLGTKFPNKGFLMMWTLSFMQFTVLHWQQDM